MPPGKEEKKEREGIDDETIELPIKTTVVNRHYSVVHQTSSKDRWNQTVVTESEDKKFKLKKYVKHVKTFTKSKINQRKLCNTQHQLEKGRWKIEIVWITHTRPRVPGD